MQKKSIRAAPDGHNIGVLKMGAISKVFVVEYKNTKLGGSWSVDRIFQTFTSAQDYTLLQRSICGPEYIFRFYTEDLYL